MTEMYHVRLDFGYNTKWDEFDYDTFKSCWPLATDEKPTSLYSVNTGPCRISSEEAAGIAILGVKLELIPYPGAMITKMEGRKAWDYGEIPQVADLVSGRAVQITIPDTALLLINEVTVKDDCCTDELQGMLDDGWRLLAVCPPNAQRRPDYVLGRRKVREK